MEMDLENLEMLGPYMYNPNPVNLPHDFGCLSQAVTGGQERVVNLQDWWGRR